jgi:glycosyltransferase involved in cell wall biosynthesis
LPRIAARDPDLEVHVLARRRFVEPGTRVFRGVTVTPLPSPAGSRTEAIGGTAVAIFSAWRRGAKVLHIHAIGPALLAPVARLLGMRVIVTHHGRDYDRAKWGRIARLALRAGERLGVLFAHKTIAVAPSLAEQLKEQFPSRAARIHYIPNGAPTLPAEDSTEDVLARFGLERGKFVLAVGRLVPEKGFDYLIRAFRRSGSARQLVIAGAAVHDSPFARALELEADASVRFIGSQPRSILRRLYETADLFVLPSFHEGLAISALEAIQCGTPILLSDITPNADLGLRPGNYFPTGDEQELSRLLAMPGDRFTYPVAEARARFDWDAIAAATNAIYREVLAGP